MNACTFVGNIGRDAEMKYTPGGTAVSKFSIAIRKPKKDGNDVKPMWLNVVLWGKMAETLTQYILKGKQVAISGELDIREYTTKDGMDKTWVEVNARQVTLLGSKSDGGDREPQTPAYDPTAPGSPITDDDIPF